MATAAIICEYNPFHRGHQKQLGLIRHQLGEDTCIVCLMSGCYVQRGAPAVFEPAVRAQAAVDCGVNVVLGLPLPAALSSAEGFAAGGVAVLERLGGVDWLCFGSESGDAAALQQTARLLCGAAFDAALREQLETGVSYARARQLAAQVLGADDSLLVRPNDILAVEYCKALLRQGSAIRPLPVTRQGSYHAEMPDAENPSATSLRGCMRSGAPWLDFVPSAARAAYRDAQPHFLQAGEQAMLARLRAMDEEAFEALPYGSEGLWRKLMHAARTQQSLEAVAAAVKSKRYARSRIDRMLLCAFLGLDRARLAEPAPYVRLLALDRTGGAFVRRCRAQGTIPLLNSGVPAPVGAYSRLEQRALRLYGLFAAGAEGQWRAMPQTRVYCKK